MPDPKTAKIDMKGLFYIRRTMPKIRSVLTGQLVPGDRGMIVKLTGAVNEQKLVELGYLSPVTKAMQDRFQCGQCQETFIGGRFLQGHGDKRHNPKRKKKSPEEQDREFEKEMLRENKEDPFFLENSKASREAGGSQVTVTGE